MYEKFFFKSCTLVLFLSSLCLPFPPFPLSFQRASDGRSRNARSPVQSSFVSLSLGCDITKQSQRVVCLGGELNTQNRGVPVLVCTQFSKLVQQFMSWKMDIGLEERR